MTDRLLRSEHLPPALASAVAGHRAITIRDARSADAPALTRLEQLGDRTLANVPVLVALVDDVIIAAAPAAGGGIVSDPFAYTADVVELLRLRTRQLRAAA